MYNYGKVKQIWYICNMKVKAIFFDIDGTLVSFKTHRIPDSTLEALTLLRKKGIKLFIATGRPWVLINNLGEAKFDGFITVNGCSCFTSDFTPIYSSSIPHEDIDRLIDSGLTENIPFAFTDGKDEFITGINERVQAMSDLIELPNARVAPVTDARGEDFYQLMGYFTKEEEQQFNIFEKILTHCTPMRWHPLFADIIPTGNSKRTGIDKVLEYFHIDLSESMGFGDGGNDIPMLQHTAIGVAMGNADDEVKAAADYVTTSIDDNGIVHALRHFKLI